jgi:Reverse transcriptase (RNA-dependent DNA polymerase)
LIYRGTWGVVAKEEVSDNANILGGRFVIAIKDEGTDKKVWKARFVVKGYRDHLKTSLVHDTATSRQHFSRVLVGLAAIFGFNLFSTDVTQAYLQSAEKLLRDVYIKPTKELSMEPGQLLKLLRPLYGLADSGDYWGRTLSNHLREDLGMGQQLETPHCFLRTFKKN